MWRSPFAGHAPHARTEGRPCVQIGRWLGRILPFETPKLAVTTNLSNENFAAMLDRAILRSQGNGRNIPRIEPRAEPDDGR